MQNKPYKNWNDVRMIMASISVALTLGFWGLFAARERAVTGISAAADMPSPPDPAAAAPLTLLPGQKLLFAGTASQVAPVVTNAKRQGGRKGGGGTVTTTRSSRP